MQGNSRSDSMPTDANYSACPHLRVALKSRHTDSLPDPWHPPLTLPRCPRLRCLRTSAAEVNPRISLNSTGPHPPAF